MDAASFKGIELLECRSSRLLEKRARVLAFQPNVKIRCLRNLGTWGVPMTAPRIKDFGWGHMNYRNADMKIDQFVSYVNDDKINLIPPFQRGHVWNLKTRTKLIENIVRGRPIPAIFLYREAVGDKYAYNILDGKQRLESLILFIGNKQSNLRIDGFTKFFFDPRTKNSGNFKIRLDGKKCGMSDLNEQLIRDLREYVIPTIEISLSDDTPTSLDEMIDLFVDINSYGEKVKRFDIVKAMSKDKLLQSAFKLIAVKETRGRDVYYKAVNNEFTRVLKRLQIVENIQNPNSKVDRMWELLVEIVMFLRTGRHRAPVDILKNFIKSKGPNDSQDPISVAEIKQLRKVFKFLVTAYKKPALAKTRLVTNQIHFYTMITSIICEELLSKYTETQLTTKLALFGLLIDGKRAATTKQRKLLSEYSELTAKHTTHPGRRTDRHNLFVKLIADL